MAKRSKANTPATTPAASPPLALPAELTIYTVGELHPQWLGWLQQDGVAVEAAAVDQVDGAGLQMLLSLSHALDRRGRQLQLHAPSPALREGCQALGLQDWLASRSTPAAAGASA